MVIFLLGSTGMIGRYIKKVIPECVCITREECDFNNDIQLYFEGLLREDDIVINCIGKVPKFRGDDEDNIDGYMKINAVNPNILAQICQRRKARLIQFSPDAVFNCRRGEYDEYDAPDGKSNYGKSKYVGESDEFGAMVIRVSVLGHNNTHTSFLDTLLTKTKLNAHDNHYWNGITCLELAMFVRQTIKDRSFWKGVRHIYGETVSSYELMTLIVKTYNLKAVVVKNFDYASVNRTLISYYPKQRFKRIYKQLREQRDFEKFF